MLLLDFSNETLLNILSLVDPVDLLNIRNVCERLRDLAEWTIYQAVSQLHLTGLNCFPNFKLQPFDNLDRIRVNNNWLDGKFTTWEWGDKYGNHHIKSGIVIDENLYIAKLGSICKYKRICDGRYFEKCPMGVIGNKNHAVISKFAKKDNVIFACCLNGSCMIFQDENPAMDRARLVQGPVRDVALFPKNDIYVTATDTSAQIFIKGPTSRTLLPVDEIPKSSRRVRIDSSGEKLIIGHSDVVSLYDFNTQNKEYLNGLDGVKDLLWRDDQSFLSGHEDGSLKLFDLRTKSVCNNIGPLIKDSNVSIQFDGQNAALCGFRHSSKVNLCDLRMNKWFNVFNGAVPNDILTQIVAEPKHLFVVTRYKFYNCDFSA